MIGDVILVAAIAFMAYKLGVANERIRHAPAAPSPRFRVEILGNPDDLKNALQRAAATREWRQS